MVPMVIKIYLDTLMIRIIFDKIDHRNGKGQIEEVGRVDDA